MRRAERLLSHVCRPASSASASGGVGVGAGVGGDLSALLQHHDKAQVEMMEERIVVVDAEDRALRAGSKVECHVNRGDNNILLHRAFSVFLFDVDSGKLLLQKRSPKKITFPQYWANTCCSHPMFTPAEMEDGVGVKRAAIRKLEQELGIPTTTFQVRDFAYLTTILYLAAGEGGWGEHEVDHILAVKVKRSQLRLDPNPNEVAEVRWVDEAELDAFLASAPSLGVKVSPWFAMIQKRFLAKWWSHFRVTGSFDALASAATRDIHHLTL